MTSNDIYYLDPQRGPMKLQGDLQMQCESGANSDYYGPSVAQGSGAACGQTQPAISNKKSCDPSPKSVGGCTATPRQSYNEMAESQIRRMSGDATEVITRELIRAREIGQREGREDAGRHNEQIVRELSSTVSILRNELVVKYRPIFVYEPDPQVAELQTKLTSLQYTSAAKERNQATTIELLMTQKQELEQKLSAMKNYSNHLEKTVGKAMDENAALAHGLEASRRNNRVARVVLRMSSFFGNDKCYALNIESQATFSDGITVFVSPV